MSIDVLRAHLAVEEEGERLGLATPADVARAQAAVNAAERRHGDRRAKPTGESALAIVRAPTLGEVGQAHPPFFLAH